MYGKSVRGWSWLWNTRLYNAKTEDTPIMTANARHGVAQQNGGKVRGERYNRKRAMGTGSGMFRRFVGVSRRRRAIHACLFFTYRLWPCTTSQFPSSPPPGCCAQRTCAPQTSREPPISKRTGKASFLGSVDFLIIQRNVVVMGVVKRVPRWSFWRATTWVHDHGTRDSMFVVTSNDWRGTESVSDGFPLTTTDA